jgi:hypothetical protein
MMSSIANEAYGREILRQANVSLQRRVVVLWQISASAEAVPILTSVPDPTYHETKLDLSTTLGHWGVPLSRGSQWVGCRLDDAGRRCVAPVRAEPAKPPPRGVERRSRERMTLELSGLCIGMLERVPIPPYGRTAESDIPLELAPRPSAVAHKVMSPLTAALASVRLCHRLLTEEWGRDPRLRPLLVEELAKVAHDIERAVEFLMVV